MKFLAHLSITIVLLNCIHCQTTYNNSESEKTSSDISNENRLELNTTSNDPIEKKSGLKTTTENISKRKHESALTSNYYFGEKGNNEEVNIASHYFFGNHTEPELRRIHREKVEYYAIPYVSRVKLYYYSDPKQRIIKAINCYDLMRTTATVEIVSGGLGFTYVTLQLQSARSHGLEYTIEIYA